MHTPSGTIPNVEIQSVMRDEWPCLAASVRITVLSTGKTAHICMTRNSVSSFWRVNETLGIDKADPAVASVIDHFNGK